MSTPALPQSGRWKMQTPGYPPEQNGQVGVCENFLKNCRILEQTFMDR